MTVVVFVFFFSFYFDTSEDTVNTVCFKLPWAKIDHSYYFITDEGTPNM